LPPAPFWGIFFGGAIDSPAGAVMVPLLIVPVLPQELQLSQQSPPRLNFFFRRPRRPWPLSQQSDEPQLLQLLVQVVVVQVLQESQLLWRWPRRRWPWPLSQQSVLQAGAHVVTGAQQLTGWQQVVAWHFGAGAQH